MALINREDYKHTPKPKRVAKQINNILFKVRNYPNSLEVVKIPNHTHLYLVGQSLVVYAAAPPPCEYDSEVGEHASSLLQTSHCQSSLEDGSSKQAAQAEGIPDPEQLHGYSFNAKVVAMGSLINNNLVYLTEEDADKCDELGIHVDMAGKLKRAHESMLKFSRLQDGENAEVDSSVTSTTDATAAVSLSNRVTKRPLGSESVDKNIHKCAYLDTLK